MLRAGLGEDGEFEGEPPLFAASGDPTDDRGRARRDEGMGIDSGAKGFLPPQKN